MAKFFDHKFFLTLLFLVFAAGLVSFIIWLYCEIFYDFGIFAKDKINSRSLIIFITTPTLFWLSACLCKYFASNAAGSNIAHIRSAVYELKKHPESFKKNSPFLSPITILCLIASSLIATFAGGSLGREGPSIQIAAGILTWLYWVSRKWLIKIDLATLTYLGIGLGLAVAFNSPIAGFVYVLENFYKDKAYRFVSSSWFLVVLAIFLTLLIAIFFREAKPVYSAQEILINFDGSIIFLFILSFFCGVSAVAFTKVCTFFYKRFSAIKSKEWHLIPLLCGLVVAVIGFYGGQYSVGGGIKTVNDALSNSGFVLSYENVFGRILSTVLTFISGCAGGIVAPAIAIGAGLAALFADILMTADIKVLILTGMVAFLSPILGAPVTAAVLILQSAAQPINSLPILLFFSVIAFVTSRIFLKLTSKLSEKFF